MSSARRIVLAMFILYALVAVFLVGAPDARVATYLVLKGTALAAHAGLPVSSHKVEFGLNAVLVAPLSFLGGILFRRLSVGDWVAVGFVASLCVELVQRLLLPTRTGSMEDIVSNTIGALLGALALWALHRAWSPRSARHGELGGVERARDDGPHDLP